MEKVFQAQRSNSSAASSLEAFRQRREMRRELEERAKTSPEALAAQQEALRNAALVARFNEPEENYQLLREGVQSQRKTESVLDQLDTDGILQKFVTETDKLIGVADGSIESRDIYDPRDEERSKMRPDVMIFLDKSARPVADLVSAFWEQFAVEGVEKPDFDFLNIDRVNWFMDQGYSKSDAETVLGPHDFDIEEVSDEDIARIRALFVRGHLTEDNWQEEMADMPTILDGKNVVIIDEVKSQGGTLSIATQLLRKAIPEALVSGQYFWETTYTRMADEKFKADSVPVWYDKENPMGRGVGDISKTYYETLYEQDPSQENLRRKIGWSVLSAPHFTLEEDGTIDYKEDKLYKRLLQDISYLTYAVGDNRVLRNPSKQRAIADRVAIVDAQDMTLEEANKWSSQSKRIKHQNRAR